MRYSDEFRAGAVLLLQGHGYPGRKGALMAVATELKVPHFTLSRWFHRASNPPPHKAVRIKKEQIIKLLKQEVHAALDEMEAARPDADYRSLATALGILIDKWQLLEGEPTARVDTLDWRTKAIELIRNREIDYEPLVQEVGSDLATELFKQARVPITPTGKD